MRAAKLSIDNNAKCVVDALLQVLVQNMLLRLKSFLAMLPMKRLALLLLACTFADRDVIKLKVRTRYNGWLMQQLLLVSKEIFTAERPRQSDCSGLLHSPFDKNVFVLSAIISGSDCLNVCSAVCIRC